MPILCRSLLSFAPALLLVPTAAVAAEAKADRKQPNVIVVLADDLGPGDVRALNEQSQIPTPALDRLAREGLSFLDAHTPSSVCTPTRYGLLTGRYAWRSRLARGVLSGTSPPLIPPERPTLASLFRSAGYHTAMIGKWHLGWNWSRNEQTDERSGGIDFTAAVDGGPDANGFDEYYAFAASLDMPPYVWVENGQPTAVPDRTEGVPRARPPPGGRGGGAATAVLPLPRPAGPPYPDRAGRGLP